MTLPNDNPKPAPDQPARNQAGPSQPSGSTAGQAPPKKKPGFFGRAMRFLLGANSRVGRFNRKLLRWVGGFVGVFALGMLSTYLLLYKPLVQQYDQAAAAQVAAEQQAKAVQSTQDTVEQNLSNAQDLNQGLVKQLDSANTHVILLQTLNDANQARVALGNKDTASAKTALSAATASLKKLTDVIQSTDASTAKDLQTRLNLAIGEVDANPTNAALDLGIFIKDLTDLESSLYGKP